MPYTPLKGDFALFYGLWYNGLQLLNFVVKARRIDPSVRANRLQLYADLEGLALPQMDPNKQIPANFFGISEFEGDWLDKFTRLRNFLSIRGTNKGNTKVRGTSDESDDRDLSSDELLTFWKVTEAVIRELRSFDYMYDADDFNTRFNWVAANAQQ
jgi:hypothetical protein